MFDLYDDLYDDGDETYVPLGQAREFCEALKNHPQISEVMIFGSVARDEVGGDLDLIILMDDEHSSLFMERVSVGIAAIEGSFSFTIGNQLVVTGDEKDVYDYSYLRRKIATSIISDNGIENAADVCGIALEDLDVFIFPVDWRSRLDELQNALPHSDPLFMENIATDAVSL